MKKITKIITLSIIAVLLALGLVSCGCEHIYDNACDADCNECGEAREVEHTYSDDDGDCTTALKCEVCSAIITEARAQHTFNEADYDDHFHYNKCTFCSCNDEATHVRHTLNDEYKCSCGAEFTAKYTASDIWDREIQLYNENGFLVKSIRHTGDTNLYINHIDYYVNENGDNLKIVYFDKGGNQNSYSLYKYGADGKCTREETYDNNGALLYYSTYEYNEESNTQSSLFYSEDGTLLDYCITTLNNKGMATKDMVYYASGNLAIYTLYTYNTDDAIIKQEDYSEEDELLVEYLYEYNNGVLKKMTKSNGSHDIIEAEEYYETGELYRAYDVYLNCLFEYDKMGFLLGYTEYNEDGTVRHINEMVRDESDRLLKKIYNNYEDGELFSISEITYNEKLMIIKEETVFYEDGESVDVNTVIYEYDENGRKIKIVKYYNGEIEFIHEYTYDENGNNTVTVEKQGNLEILRMIYMTYYEGGVKKSATSYYGNSDVVEYEILYYENEMIKSEVYYYMTGDVNRRLEYDEDGNLTGEFYG